MEKERLLQEQDKAVENRRKDRESLCVCAREREKWHIKGKLICTHMCSLWSLPTLLKKGRLSRSIFGSFLQ